MTEQELVVGETYFMVTYPDSSMRTPIIITYEYLGKNLLDSEDENPAPYYFRCLPAFLPESTSAGADWSEKFPELFRDWGEDVPTAFQADKLEGFCTIEGLVADLAKLRDRLRSRS